MQKDDIDKIKRLAFHIGVNTALSRVMDETHLTYRDVSDKLERLTEDVKLGKVGKLEALFRRIRIERTSFKSLYGRIANLEVSDFEEKVP